MKRSPPEPPTPRYVTEDRLDEILDEKLADFFGKLNVYFDKRFAEMEARLDKKYGPTLVVCDALQKYVTDTSHETAALSVQVDRPGMVTTRHRHCRALYIVPNV